MQRSQIKRNVRQINLRTKRFNQRTRQKKTKNAY